eukprot:TRINITY_DN3448_c0_g3_i1.p1 TRINITY_DN3448_c0_g3~~TRINITY_DN3448_c0_g3_i1.p1  ORF type:complete len:222 (+),score=12.84 TRINITY_DN3448_c0_g3_i1:217-882(+)
MRCRVLHGDKTQIARDKVMFSFKTGKCNVLVATDIAARGLDVRDIKYVINYDFPNQISDYIHRIGRTGRAGAVGISYTFLTQESAKYAQELIELLEESDIVVPEVLREIQANAKKYGYQGSNYNNRDKPYYNKPATKIFSTQSQTSIRPAQKPHTPQSSVQRQPHHQHSFSQLNRQDDMAWKNLVQKQDTLLVTKQNDSLAPKFGFFNSKKVKSDDDNFHN